MNKKYLDKVIDRIVDETIMDYEQQEISLPFSHLSLFLPFISFPSPISYSNSTFPHLFSFFFKHCRDVYGLTKDETIYIWAEYRNIIKNKIDNS